jgi:hypothetical protein
VSSKAKCFVPAELLAKAISEKKWEALVALHEDGRIVGTVVKRWFDHVTLQGAAWPRMGIVDFFCVSPAWRKKGVGRLLLCEAHNQLQLPLTPMLILWEGLQFRQPAVCTGIFWVRQKPLKSSDSQAVCLQGEEAEKAWSSCVKGKFVRSGEIGKALETTVWRLGGGQTVAVWDTHHRSVPEGYRICVVVAWEGIDAVDAFVEAQGHPWQIFLCCSQMSEEWEWDSTFQWIGYNLQLGHTSMEFPCLAF